MTGNKFFRTITEEILDYVIRELTSTDADIDTQQHNRQGRRRCRRLLLDRGRR